jgi:hypothetical protein
MKNCYIFVENKEDMKNIHVLPTDKPSRLIKSQDNDFILLNTDAPNWLEINLKTKNQHIYITSDEEIKKGDWCINPKNNKVMKVGHHGHHGYSSKKIILTTDVDLIKDGVQAIDNEFLEWFVKNPSCEEVKVGEIYPSNCCINKEGKTKMNNDCMERNRCLHYKIIIPKEEPKQETVEEAKIEYHFENDIEMFEFMNEMASTGKIPKKWSLFVSKINDLYRQQKRSYSEEEVIEILIEYDYSKINDDKLNSVGMIKEWFKQFKKK